MLVAVRDVQLRVQAHGGAERRRSGELGPVLEHVRADRVGLGLRADGDLVDRANALDGIREVRAEMRPHRGDLVVRARLAFLRTHRDRADRGERDRWERAAPLEVRAERAAGDRENDVVHGAADEVLHFLDVVERDAREREVPSRRDALVEVRRRRLEHRHAVGVRRILPEPDDVLRRLHRALRETQEERRLLHARLQRVRDELEVRRDRFAVRRRGRRQSRRHPLRVHEVHEERCPGDTIDERVMELEDEAEAPVLEPLDHPQLPERTRAIERRAQDATRHRAELDESARLRQRDLTDVMDDVEVRILDPKRMVEGHRDLDQTPTEIAIPEDLLLNTLGESGERIPAGNLGRIEHRRECDVHLNLRRFQIKERGVEPRQPFHAHLSSNEPRTSGEDDKDPRAALGRPTLVTSNDAYIVTTSRLHRRLEFPRGRRTRAHDALRRTFGTPR